MINLNNYINKKVMIGYRKDGEKLSEVGKITKTDDDSFLFETKDYFVASFITRYEAFDTEHKENGTNIHTCSRSRYDIIRIQNYNLLLEIISLLIIVSIVGAPLLLLLNGIRRKDLT